MNVGITISTFEFFQRFPNQELARTYLEPILITLRL